MADITSGVTESVVRVIIESVVTLLVGYFFKILIEWILAHGRKTVAYLLLLGVGLLAWAAPVWLGVRWWLYQTPFSPFDQQIILAALVSQLIIMYLLFCVVRKEIRNRVHDVQVLPTAFAVVAKKSLSTGDAPGRVVPGVRRLNDKGIGEGQKMLLSRRTFCEGIESLTVQIRAHAPKVAPELYVGINLPGVAMAALVAENLAPGHTVPMGVLFLLTSTDGHHKIDVERSSLPAATNNPRQILVFDKEIKSGDAVKNAVIFLREKYGATATIRIAVLVGAEVDTKRIRSMRDLLKDRGEQGGVNSEEYLPDFLAFISKNSVDIDSKH